VFESIPFVQTNLKYSQFIPIFPTENISKITNGVAFIRFAVSSKLSSYFLKAFEFVNSNWEILAEETKVIKCSCQLFFPYDFGRVENALTIVFLENDFYRVEIWLYEKNNPASGEMVLFYQVSGAGHSDYVLPVNYFFKGRIPVPINSDLFNVNPSESFLVFSSSVLQIDVKIQLNSKLQLKLKSFKGDYTVSSEIVESKTVDQYKNKTYLFHVETVVYFI
jgi:hypothetical protein